MKRKFPFSIEPRHIFILLAAVCVILIVITGVSGFSESQTGAGVSRVLMPMQKGLNRLGSFVYDKIEELHHYSRLEEENASLKEELGVLREQNARYQLRLGELEQYQELLELSEQYPDYHTVGAHIISRNSGNWYETFIVDKGSAEGILPGMNVIANGGLVGIVTSADTHTAVIHSIIDNGRSVAGMSLISKAPCVITGNSLLYPENKLDLGYVDKDDDLSDDDKIVTSDTSSEYLPGILIGYAADITVDANSLTKSGHLIPIVDFTHLDTVLIITDLKETGASS